MIVSIAKQINLLFSGPVSKHLGGKMQLALYVSVRCKSKVGDWKKRWQQYHAAYFPQCKQYGRSSLTSFMADDIAATLQEFIQKRQCIN